MGNQTSRQSGGRVLVVDDGSSDGGVDTLGGLEVGIIRHAKNLGKGAAILSAAKKALKAGVTHMVTLDADGQHDPDDLRRFIPELEAHPDAIIIEDLFIDATGDTGEVVNYYIEMEKVKISEWKGALAMVRNSNQDV